MNEVGLRRGSDTWTTTNFGKLHNDVDQFLQKLPHAYGML